MKKLYIVLFLVIIFIIFKMYYLKNSNNNLEELYDNPIKINQIYEDYTYDEYDNHITIKTYNGSDSKVIIPSYINNKPVYSLDDSAFYGNQNLKKIEIPNTVIRIGHQSFIGNDNLETVIMSDNLIDIGEWAFKVCTNLKEIYVKKNSDGDKTLNNSPFSEFIVYK